MPAENDNMEAEGAEETEAPEAAPAEEEAE